MPRMSKDQIVSLKEEYKNGEKPSALMTKYNITKHALYHHVGGSKKVNTSVAKEKVFDDTDSEAEPTEKGDAGIPETDPLIDFDKLMSNSVPNERKKAVVDDDIFNVFNVDEELDPFHPSNLLEDKSSKPAQSGKAKSLSLRGLMSGKGLGEDLKKTPEEKKKEEEEERLKLVYQVRMYLYTFRDHDHLFTALSIENDNKKINRFIQDLYKKKSADLKKLLHFIKFHIRHNNHSVTGNFVSSILFTLIRVLELIVTRFGIDISGLSEELKSDPEMISNLKEIEIEMTANKLNVGAKADILLKICTKGLSKFTENKMINKMKSMQTCDKSKQAMDQLNSKPINNELKNKYNDL
jgi:hypothetical protein